MALRPDMLCWKAFMPAVEKNTGNYVVVLQSLHCWTLCMMCWFVAHWVVPPRLASDIKWLICYVTLSRAPSLKQLVSIGLSDKIREILEAGPPEGMVQMFSTLFADKIEETRAAALRAKQNLGW